MDEQPDANDGHTDETRTEASSDAIAPLRAGELGPHPERHPDDLPPPEHDRRRIPSGVLWAIALGIVVITVASFMALSTESSTPSNDLVLDDPNQSLTGGLGLTGVDVTGQPAPTTSFESFDGGRSSLADHAGTPIVLNFWQSSCTPCILEMPAIEQVHRSLGDQVAFVGLAANDIESDAREMAESTGVTYELGFDREGSIFTDMGAVRLPTTYFIAGDGTIVDIHTGELDEAQLEAKIADAFGVEAAPAA